MAFRLTERNEDSSPFMTEEHIGYLISCEPEARNAFMQVFTLRIKTGLDEMICSPRAVNSRR